MMEEDFLWRHCASPQAYLTHMTTGVALAVTHGEQNWFHAFLQFAGQLSIHVDECSLLRVIVREGDVIGRIAACQPCLG